MNGVWNQLKTNQKGFTLVEVMTAFILVTLIVTVFMHAYTIWRHVDTSINNPTDQELLLFQMQLNRLFELETDFEISSKSGIDTWSDDHQDVISYSQYQGLIRRQVNNLGHEVLMQRITHFRVYDHPEGLELHLQLDGETRMWVMHHPGRFVQKKGDS